MIKLLLIGLSLVFPIVVTAKVWTNAKGSSFRGNLISVSSNDVKIERLSDGKLFTIDRSQLSEADNNYLKELILSEYKRSQSLKRKTIPSFNQSDFRGGRSSCSPSSMMNFIVWWSTFYDAFHRGGNSKQNVAKIQRSLVNYSNSGSGGSSFKDIVDALEQYFIKYVDGYAFAYEIIYYPEIPQLKNYTKGSNAVLMSNAWYELSGGRLKYISGHATSLVDASDEHLLFNTWGTQYLLKMRACSNDQLKFLKKNKFANWGLKYKRTFLQLSGNRYSRRYDAEVCLLQNILVVTPLKL